MVINDLIIEVTRRCNMQCPHCLRGDAENIDMDIKYVDILFSKIDRVSSLTFTGGEPSLVPHIINQILDLAEKHNVYIDRFYLVTNGKKISMEFIQVLLRMYEMVIDNSGDEDYLLVNYSNDCYHNDGEEKDIKLLKALRFVEPRQLEDNEEYECIDQGNAFWNIADRRPLDNENFYLEDEEEKRIDGNVYLNCNGHIIAGCDWSYDNQDDIDNESGCRICLVEDFSFEQVKEYNKQFTDHDYVLE